MKSKSSADPTQLPDESGEPVTDWKAHAKELLKKLELHRQQAEKYEDALKRLVSTHETDSEAVEKLKREVALRDQDIAFLWQEIEALQHGQVQLEAIRDHRLKELQLQLRHRENADRRIAYFEQVIGRQSEIIDRLEQEIRLRAAHLESLKQTRGWKIGKTFSGKEMGAPVDLSSLPPLPEEVQEPGYEVVEALPPAPVAQAFERTFTKDESIAVDYHAALEAPRSFVSPAIGQKVNFAGWCFDREGHAPVKMWAEVGEMEVPVALGGVRDDIVQHFEGQIEVEHRCGFLAEVSTGPGENFIEIHAQFADGSQAMLFKRIVVNLGFETTPKRQLDEDYQSWIRCFDTLTEQDLNKQRDEAAQFEAQPLISILLPVYDTPERWLREVIESVLTQSYENWQLCIADDHSPSAHVREILEDYASKDERIRVVFREENGHISAATNSALEVADGEFCALLDHDDLLPPHALYHVVRTLNEWPEADLLYSDEDKVDAEGKRFDPYFKSDWNPDLFLSHNCISHLGVYRTRILREIEGFREDLYGSQDWDMALRFLLKTTPDRIVHIPRVLYHWRYLDTSTSKTIDSKPYAVTAGKRAIEAYLEERGVHGEVMEGMWPGAYRVKYELPKATKASILIPTRNQADVTRRCIESLLRHTQAPEFEILLVDNQSDEADALEWFASLASEDRVRVLSYDQPFNFSAINNLAATEATGDVLILLNNDVEILDETWLEELCSQAMRPEVGAVGGWLLYPDHRVQHAGILLGVCGIAVEAFKFQLEWNIGHMGRAHLNQNYSAVTGACLATRREVWQQLGGMNANELAVAYNDVDYCLRARRELGLATVWTPYAKLIHHESVSRGYEITPEQQERMEREADYMRQHWGELLKADPFYNPNLSNFDPQFNLAWPPRVK